MFDLDKNIDRIIQQCNGGDEAMTFLAIYSFMEGYGRDKLKLPFDGEKKYFNNIIYELSKYWSKSERNVIDSLEAFYNDWINYRSSITYEHPTNANKIRHCFDSLSDKSFLSTVIYQFEKFAELENFNVSLLRKIKDLRKTSLFDDWKNNKVNANGSEKVELKNSFFTEYKELSENKIKNIQDSIAYLEKSILDGKLPISEYQKKSKELSQLKEEYKKIDFSLLNSGTKFKQLIIAERTKRHFKAELITLTDEQKNILSSVDKQFIQKKVNTKDMLITGGPGTGKTLILISLLAQIFDNGKSALLLTYYPSLNKYIKYLFDLYSEKLSGQALYGANKVVIQTLESLLKSFDDWFSEIFKLPVFGFQVEKYYTNKNKYEQTIQQWFSSDSQNYLDAFRIACEEIWPDKISKNEYCKNTTKESVWNRIEEIKEKFLQQQNPIPVPDVFAYYYLNEQLDEPHISKLLASSNLKREFILVDEAQDLTNAQISVVKKLTNTCIFAGDMNQSIRNTKVSWEKLGFDIKGRGYSQTLKKNCRSTFEIQELIKKYHDFCNTKEKLDLTAQGNGPQPNFFMCENQNNEMIKQIVTAVKFYIEDCAQDLDDICITAFSESELNTIQNELKKVHVQSLRIKDKDFDFSGKINPTVRLSKICNIKGIDCVHLFCVLDSKHADEKESSINSANISNAIFTCLSRAMCSLNIFMNNDAQLDEFINLKNIFYSNNSNVFLKKNNTDIDDISEKSKDEKEFIDVSTDLVSENKDTKDYDSTPTEAHSNLNQTSLKETVKSESPAIQVKTENIEDESKSIQCSDTEINAPQSKITTDIDTQNTTNKPEVPSTTKTETHPTTFMSQKSTKPLGTDKDLYDKDLTGKIIKKMLK